MVKILLAASAIIIIVLSISLWQYKNELRHLQEFLEKKYKIEQGMPMEDVIRIMGKPDTIIQKSQMADSLEDELTELMYRYDSKGELFFKIIFDSAKTVSRYQVVKKDSVPR